MPAKNSLVSTDVYLAFRSLPPKGWMSIVRLYEAKRDEVLYLPSHKRAEILSMYLESLYELRDYVGLSECVDELIHLSLSEEIPIEVGRVYYEEALFWKANAALHLQDYPQARHILQQLSAMNCSDGRYRKRLVKTLCLDKPFWLKYSKALSVLLSLSALFVILLEILVLGSFYPTGLAAAKYIRNCMVAGAAVMYVAPEGFHRLKCWWKVRCI